MTSYTEECVERVRRVVEGSVPVHLSAEFARTGHSKRGREGDENGRERGNGREMGSETDGIRIQTDVPLSPKVLYIRLIVTFVVRCLTANQQYLQSLTIV